jgi:hypothetical protein
MLKIVKYIAIILMLCLILISCAKQDVKVKPDKKTNPAETTENTSGNFIGDESSFIKSLTDQALKEAHLLVPAYPGAQIDKTKGAVTKSGQDEIYNLVYYTDDPCSKVHEFFMEKISGEYLKQTSPVDSKDWIQLDYNAENVGHHATILIRKTPEGNTEIVYVITREEPSSK